MTMFTLPNFCRVCLKYDKNLIDLAHIENEPSETLMSKLQHCVSEVEWTVFKPLLCHPCIKRLNIAYMFKRQCVQSAGVLKNYVELVKESQKKTESQNTVKSENTLSTTGGAYMLLPNQKYVKILVGPQNQGTNTFQNVFLNLIPATTLNSITTTPTSDTSATNATNVTQNKDTNQNVFLNLNNTFQKFIPVAPPAPIQQSSEILEAPKKEPPKLINTVNVNVNQLLTESKSEEVSVEVDPTVFGLEDEEAGSNDEEETNDYDEVISQAKITLKDFKSNGERIQNGKDDQKYYVPILPKNHADDFSTSGEHFLFSKGEKQGAFVCESCQKYFSSKKFLKYHFNQFHMGKLPFKCEFCYIEYVTRTEYDRCIKNHNQDADSLNKSITLQDLADSPNTLTLAEVEASIPPPENGEYICDVCRRPFSSATGVLRHKVRKHNQTNKKKYFIKGMKNAKCDICNREFSTHSYMLLHKKLHLRDDIGYKYKVFGKSKYGDVEIKEEPSKRRRVKRLDELGEEAEREEGQHIENLDITPDICTEDDDRKTDEDSNDGEKTEDLDPLKDIKMEVDEEDENSDDNSNADENSHTEYNSNQENSNDGDNHDTDARTSEKN